MSVPVFIICRDRLTPLLSLLDFLERSGCTRIYLIDNASSYPPLLDYYSTTPHEVIRLKENLGQKALWEADLLAELNVTGPFVLSDPDIVPIEECPLDALDYFAEILDRYPGCVKAGFGLKIDDLPDHFHLKQEVIDFESGYSGRQIAPRLYQTAIDTTFALNRANSTYSIRPSIRTGYPYLARHTTWYVNSNELPEEERFYRERARVQILTWGRGYLPVRMAKLLGRPLQEAAPAEETGSGAVLAEAGDRDSALATDAWKREPPTVDEGLFTPWAEQGWVSWNDMSPEAQFCAFVAGLVRLIGPGSLIETGTGQGFLTRRIRQQLGKRQELTCFEDDPRWRAALASLPFFDDPQCVLSPDPSPSAEEFARARLAVLDSSFRTRFPELEAWWQFARQGSLVVVHDTGNGHPPNTPHARLAERITELGVPGVFLKNPRGAFLGVKTKRSEG